MTVKELMVILNGLPEHLEVQVYDSDDGCVMTIKELKE